MHTFISLYYLQFLLYLFDCEQDTQTCRAWWQKRQKQPRPLLCQPPGAQGRVATLAPTPRVLSVLRVQSVLSLSGHHMCEVTSPHVWGEVTTSQI